MDFISPKYHLHINHWLDVNMTLLGVSLALFNSIHCVRFDALIVVLMKIQVFWNCVLLKNTRVSLEVSTMYFFKINATATENV